VPCTSIADNIIKKLIKHELKTLTCGESLHLETLAEFAMLISVDLGDHHTRVQFRVGGDSFPQFFVFWSQTLAMTAPGSVKLDKRSLGAIDHFVKS